MVIFELNKIAEHILSFLTYSQLGPCFINLFVQYSQSDLSLCGEAPSRDLNPGRADLLARTLDHLTSLYIYTDLYYTVIHIYCSEQLRSPAKIG